MAALFNQYIPQQAGHPGPPGHTPGQTGPRQEPHHQPAGGSGAGSGKGDAPPPGPENLFAALSGLFSKFFGGEKNAGGKLSGILQKLKLEDWDAGDLLLLGILLLVLLEGDNMELVIALGLIILLSLD